MNRHSPKPRREPRTRPQRHPALSIALLWCLPDACTPLRDLSSYSNGAAPITSADSDAPAAGGSFGAPAPPEDLGAASPAPDESAPSTDAAGDGDVEGDGDIDVDGGAEVADAGRPSTSSPCDGAGELGGADGHCYLLGAEAASWTSSSTTCAAWGGTLVQIDTPEEEALVTQNTTADTWIGLNDRDAEGRMSWDGSGEPIAYAPWATEQPDDFDGSEDCVELLADGRGYNDRPCTDLRVYVCER